MKIYNSQFSDDFALRNSLSAIRRAQTKLDRLTRAPLTTTALESRIELCEILLSNISSIQNSLAENLHHAVRVPSSAR
jgi:hypothetical protein